MIIASHAHPLAARRLSPTRRSPGLVFISLLVVLGAADLLAVLLVAGAAAVYYPQLPALDKVTEYCQSPRFYLIGFGLMMLAMNIVPYHT